MEKKFNYNIIVFVVIAFLVVAGWCCSDMINGTKDAVIEFFKSPSPGTLIDSIDATSKRYSWRYFSIDLYSLTYLITDTKSMDKGADIVVRMDNDYLDLDIAPFSNEDIQKRVDSCVELNDFCKKSNIPFMYIYAPTKSYYGKYPIGSETTDKKEGEKFVSSLRENGVNTLSFAELMLEQNKSLEESYFKTDHHWTPETAFWANGEILKKLQNDYGFKYDKEFTDINNFNIKIFEDSFLGSQGKITGRYFSPIGIDDISLITPKFETSFTATDSEKTINGKFEDTLIDKGMLECETVHRSNHYSMYTGANFGELFIENHNAPNDAKILLIRDSYAWPVIPYMALNAKSLQMLDLRGSRPMNNIMEYIDKNDFDYVLILYSALESEIAYDFNLE